MNLNQLILLNDLSNNGNVVSLGLYPQRRHAWAGGVENNPPSFFGNEKLIPRLVTSIQTKEGGGGVGFSFC